MLRSLVGSEMCIRDRYQRRVRGSITIAMLHNPRWERPPRTELPAVGVEDMLGFDWQTFSENAAHIPPAQRAHAQIAQALEGTPAPPATQRQLTDLTQNIADLKDSIQELKHERRSSSGEHLMLDALVAFTKSTSAQQSAPSLTVSDKKRARMERNRASAQESRERKRRYTEGLQEMVAKLVEENAVFRKEGLELKQQVETLRAEIARLKGSKPAEITE
eukprot:TRINITY_DN9470_c0_g1_i3.p1 TRINITY_DN9470_c0_g1~~TRINITY_DN9470_c0_g1_i3.p1  ORF type:complete len:219 (-),score=55.45 TRINITY_DN9470_c0_g1_i3:185-841(-)